MAHDLEDALRTSGIGRATSLGWILFDTTLTVRDCNDAMLHFVDLPREQFIDRDWSELPWSLEREDGTPLSSEDRPASVALRTGRPVANAVLGLNVAGKSHRWLSVNTYPAIEDGAMTGVLASYYDVTELVEGRRHLEVMLAASRTARSVDHDVDYFQALCTTLVEQGGYPLAFISEHVGDAKKIVCAAGLVDRVPEILATNPSMVETGAGLAEAAIRTGSTRVANEIPDTRPSSTSHAVGAELAFRSGIAVPIATEGRAMALNIYSNHFHHFDDVTVHRLEGAVREIEFGVAHVATTQRLRSACRGTQAALTDVTELRDPYTAGHQHNVGLLGAAIAAQLGIDRKTTELIEQAGRIHDVGKVSIPAEILTLPGRLDPLEYQLMQRHSAVGGQILTHAALPWPIPEVASQHHERLDGSGYPLGLRGDEIAQPVRIISVADVVEAMMHHRPYRPALGIDAALAEITRGAGTLYDSDVVTACMAVFDSGFSFEPTTRTGPAVMDLCR